MSQDGPDASSDDIPPAELRHHRGRNLPGRAGETQSRETCHWRRWYVVFHELDLSSFDIYDSN